MALKSLVLGAALALALPAVASAQYYLPSDKVERNMEKLARKQAEFYQKYGYPAPQQRHYQQPHYQQPYGYGPPRQRGYGQGHGYGRPPAYGYNDGYGYPPPPRRPPPPPGYYYQY